MVDGGVDDSTRGIVLRDQREATNNSASKLMISISKPRSSACDGPPVGVGAMLVQYDSKTQQPLVITNNSRFLSNGERQYGQIERESMASTVASETRFTCLDLVSMQLLTINLWFCCTITYNCRVLLG